jgi:hypothetical protein
MPEIQIPFSGFYESAHSHILDSEFEQMHDFDDPADDPAPGEEFSYTPALLNAYCREYVEAFTCLLPDGCKLEYLEVISPREYNFTTDRIFCDISPESLALIEAQTNEKDLRDVIRENCTSYDGFISFFSNDRDDLNDWPLNVADWQPCQLELLLIAYLRSTDQEIDEWELMEPARCNGHISNLLDLGIKAGV